MKHSDFGTIRVIRRRLVDEGYPISEYALRQWVKKGTLPAVYSGNRAFITYANVIKVLECATTAAPSLPTSNTGHPTSQNLRQ